MTTFPKSTRRNIKLNKFAFGTPWLPDLLSNHWFMSPVWNFCRWVADVPLRETSLSANERGETSAFRRLPLILKYIVVLDTNDTALWYTIKICKMTMYFFGLTYFKPKQSITYFHSTIALQMHQFQWWYLLNVRESFLLIYK